jgi:hypothetical protein
MKNVTQHHHSHEKDAIIALGSIIGLICFAALLGLFIRHCTRTTLNIISYFWLRCCPHRYTRLQLAEMQDEAIEL